jgi:chromosome segregation ATPase
MSSSGGSSGRPEIAALQELERAVAKAADRLGELARRVDEAEARSRQLEELVGRFTGNAEEAGQLLTRLGRLDEENADMKARLEEGRAGVDRILARIRFMEDQR